MSKKCAVFSSFFLLIFG